MAIGNAAQTAKKNAEAARKTAKKESNRPTVTAKAAPLAGHEDRSATLRLYVKDKELLKRAKMAALEEETSLSQLWEEWATDWLDNR